MSGTLFVIATPLGNLSDLSPRAREVLGRVSLVACEDTRRTGNLLRKFDIRTPTVSCHKFNEDHRVESLLERLNAGEDIGLVSDGGTPAISDPGALLVERVLAAGFPVVPLPGPSAVITLLSASGLQADRFVFDGFLPHRAGERRRRIRELAAERRTVVVYESPHRILETLGDVESILGTRLVVLGRELTKAHEEILRGSGKEIAARLTTPVRGEIVFAWAGGDGQQPVADNDPALVAYREALSRHDGDRRAALKDAAKALGLKKAEFYRRLAEWGVNDRPD